MQSPIVKAASSPRPPRFAPSLIVASAVLALALALAVTTVGDGQALSETRAFAVLLWTLLGAGMTGLGCVPLAWLLPRLEAGDRDKIQGQAGAITAGAMAFASIDLLLEGARSQISSSSLLSSAIGVVVGAVFVAIADLLVRYLDVSVGDWKGTDNRQAVLIMVVMTLHSFAEGMGIGVSFSDDADRSLGPFIALSIGLHNVAEGAIIGLSLMPRGTSWRRATALAVSSSLPQPIVALPCFALVQDWNTLLPFGLSAAAGAMLYLVATEICPDALRFVTPASFVRSALASAAVMAVFRTVAS